jgi:N6-adenosine-specific RNA methylase IME4
MKRKRTEKEDIMKETNEDLLRVNGNLKRNIIYADPPWNYRSGETIKGRASNHYDTMTLKELKQLKVNEISDDDCILFLWTTGPHLGNAIELMESWGFRYVTMFFVWVKTTNGKIKGGRCGFYTRQSSEFVLMGTKGKIGKFKCNQDYIPNTFLKDSTVHSEKPKDVKECIDKMFLNVPKIELFARESSDLNWDYWGNEVTKFGTKSKE